MSGHDRRRVVGRCRRLCAGERVALIPLTDDSVAAIHASRLVAGDLHGYRLADARGACCGPPTAADHGTAALKI
jgi:hypothetical protein